MYRAWAWTPSRWPAWDLPETTFDALRARHEAELQTLVARAIAAADGNKLEAARALGLSRQGLYRILERRT